MNHDTLSLLHLISDRPDSTREELIDASGFGEVTARLGTLQTHGLVIAKHKPGRGGKSTYSATPKGVRLLASLEKPTGEVAGPRIPYPSETYRPKAWIPPRELARTGRSA